MYDYTDKDGNDRQQYIRSNKNQNFYSWVEQPKGFYGLESKEKKIKKHYLWDEVRDSYLQKKCNNEDENKKSRSLYAETINEIYNKCLNCPK